MRTYGSGEYYESKQFNAFPEYKTFTAEEYYSDEAAKTPSETDSVSEHFGEGTQRSKSSDRSSTANNGDMRRNLDRMKDSPQVSDFSDTASLSSSSSSSSSGSAASSASTTSSIVGTVSTASSAAVGSVAATTTVAAVAFIVIAVIGLFVNFGNFIKTHVGMDYMTLTIDIDEFIASKERAASLLPSDFAIEYDTGNGNERIALQSGKRTYLITGLEPGSSFTYKVVCTALNLSSEYYTDTVSVPSFSEPTGVFDEINSSVSLDGETKSATFAYSVYLSDSTHKYSNAAFYICAAEHDGSSEMKSVIYSSEATDENGFFRGEAENVTSEKLYLYILAESAEEGTVLLFSYTLDTGIPDEWLVEPSVFAIDEQSETVSCLPNLISVSGDLTALDSSVSLGVYFAQYDSKGNLIENSEAMIMTDGELMTYSLECPAHYGVATYKYVVFTYPDGGVGQPVTVYESNIKSFTANQSFAASYKRITPANAVLAYYGDGSIEITVDPGFSTKLDDVFRYKLAVVNGTGKVFGEYYGTGEAVIKVYDLTDLDEIIFVYYDCAEFAGEYVEYESYQTEGIPFCVPSLTLSDTLGFEGEHFTVSYTLNMIYDYDYASLDLLIEKGQLTYTKSVDVLSESGTVILDMVDGELGSVTVSAYLNFADSTLNSGSHRLLLDSANLDMSYRFSVTGVLADISVYDTNTVPVTVKFDGTFIPSTYSLKVTDSEGYVNITAPITDGVCSFNTIPIGLDDVLTLTITDSNGDPWGETYTYSISQANAKENYTPPTFYSANPGEALVTYNDDGTINIYRDVNFSSENENVYYNAFIYSLSKEQDGDGSIAYERSYDIIGRDRYAVIENIPMDTYFLIYYFMFDFDGVSYVMYTETPSGSVYFPESFGNLEVMAENGSTTVNVQLTSYGRIDDRVTVNGVDYTYESNGELLEYISLSLDGEVNVTSVTVYYNCYYGNYDSISAGIEIHGNLYKAITFEITPQL